MPVYNVFRQQMVVHLRSLCFSQMVMQRRRLWVFHMFSQCSARPCQIGHPEMINKQLNLTPGFPRLFQNSQGDHCWQGDFISHTITAGGEGGCYTGESCSGVFQNPPCRCAHHPRPTVFLISLCAIRSSYKNR